MTQTRLLHTCVIVMCLGAAACAVEQPLEPTDGAEEAGDDPAGDDSFDDEDVAPPVMTMETADGLWRVAAEPGQEPPLIVRGDEPLLAAATTSTNVLTNSGFEYAGAWRLHDGGARSTGAAYRGSWSLRTLPRDDFRVVASQRRRAEPGRLYSLWFEENIMHAAGEGSGYNLIALDFRDEDGRRIGWGGGTSGNLLIVGSWQKGGVLYSKAPAGTAYVRVFFYSHNTQYSTGPDPQRAFWDAVRLESRACIASYSRCQPGIGDDSCYACCNGSAYTGDVHYCK